MAVLLHDRPETAGQKQREALRLPRTSAVVALFAFSSRMRAPVPEETAARKALGLFAQYRIMLRPYGMKNLFDEIYRMGTTDDEHRLYHLRRCCEDVLDDFGARSTLNGYHYAARMLLYALYAERPRKIGDLQEYVASG